MIKIEKTDVFGWDSAIRGMRNPMNSWDKSDSHYGCGDVYCYECKHSERCPTRFQTSHFEVGPNDLALMKKLVKAGSDHSKFMRMIDVTCDITASLYWWKEYDTYKVGTVANSCSTMHKIHVYEIGLDDCSHEKLTHRSRVVLETVLSEINFWRGIYINGGNVDGIYYEPRSKHAWEQMIQLLPTSYNQKRTVQLNYAVLRNMYHSRKNHKLDEWRNFCEWVETLPYAELITDGGNNDD